MNIPSRMVIESQFSSFFWNPSRPAKNKKTLKKWTQCLFWTSPINQRIQKKNSKMICSQSEYIW